MDIPESPVAHERVKQYNYSSYGYRKIKKRKKVRRIIEPSEYCSRCFQMSIVLIEVGIMKPIYELEYTIGDEFINVQRLCNTCLSEYWKPISNTHMLLEFFFPSMAFCHKSDYEYLRKYIIEKGTAMKNKEEDDFNSIVNKLSNASF